MKHGVKRLLSCFLALCMILMSTPFPALAEDPAPEPEPKPSITVWPSKGSSGADVTLQVNQSTAFTVDSSGPFTNVKYEWTITNPDLVSWKYTEGAEATKKQITITAKEPGTFSVVATAEGKNTNTNKTEKLTEERTVEIMPLPEVPGTTITITNPQNTGTDDVGTDANPLTVYENESFILRANVTGLNGVPATNQEVGWTISNNAALGVAVSPPNSATFTARPLVDNNPVKVDISASSKTYSITSGKYYVEILKRPTLSLSYAGEALPKDIDLGAKHSFTFKVDTNRKDDDISVRTERDGIVSVKQNGSEITVTGIAKGTVSITVSVENISTSFKVNVYNPATSLEKSESDDKLPTTTEGMIRLESTGSGSRITLKPSYNPGADIVFAPSSQDNKGSVNVTSDGRVTPKTTGIAVVTVRGMNDTLKNTDIPDDAKNADPLVYTIEVVGTATGISLVDPVKRSIAVGGYTDITATARDASNDAEKKIQWSIKPDNETVTITPQPTATDPNQIRITGLKPGTVEVIATTANGISASYTITVSQPVTNMRIVAEEAGKPVITHGSTEGSAEVFVGDRFQLAVNFTPDGTTAPITWKSSSTGIASIENGLLTAKNTGDVKITATIPTIKDDGTPTEKSYVLNVKVKPVRVTSLTMKGLDKKDGKFVATTSLDTKLSLRDYLQVEPSNASNPSVTWTSSDESIAPVKNGIITPLKVGTATITATSDDDKSKSVSVTVTVTASSPTGILLNPRDPVTLEINQSQTFTAVLTPAGSDGTVKFGKQGDDIFSYTLAPDKNKILNITAKKPGEATLVAQSGTLDTSVKITVSGVVIDDEKVINGNLSLVTGRSASVTKKLYGKAKTLNAKDWAWSSDNDTVARVNESSGLITGNKPGTAKISCKNQGYKAEFTVTVGESSATVLPYKMGDDKTYSFSSKILGDIRNQCKTTLGSDLDYVTNLSVPPSQGTLYYGYVSETNPGQGVAVSDKFYYKTSVTGTNRPDEIYRYAVGKPLDKLLADVTFVPATGFSGKANISYTAVSDSGKELTGGTIQITVPVASELSYNSPNGEAVHFVTNDFSTLSQTLSGYPISSVRFNAPSERYGYLYYEYSGGDVYGSNINSGQRFYASSTPSLESVAFVPRAGYTGTFPITFTGWNTNGSSFTGTIRITVKTTGEGGGDISYTTLSGSRVYFDASDFQALCRTATGGKLNYIQFTALPTASGSSSSSSAVLYHGSGSGSRVGTSASIYVSSSGSRWTIDNVYLLPSSSYTGQVTIPFKGWDTDRKTFEGTIVVDVTKDGGTAATIYMTCNGMPLVFRRADFDDACKDALPAALKSVRFKLPGRNSGTLYERFKDLNDRKPLAANQDIPAADLVTLSFLPKGESSGTVYLSYTATDEKGNVCDGQVRITAEPNPVSLYFTDLDNTVWAIPSINFLRTYDVVKGKGKKRFQPNDTLKRGDFVLMLARAFNFQLNGSASFPDVPRNSYYAGAIAAAKSLGLIKGSGQNGSFRPEAEITRQEAATILFRVLQREQNLSAADLGYLTSYSDSGQIDTYAQTALATLIRDGVFEGSGGRLYPYSPLTRAQMAVILHRAIT